MTIERIKPGPIMSQAVAHGDRVYLAGLVAADLDADTKGQTEQILAKVDELLAAAGSDKSKILKANIWLTRSEERRAGKGCEEVWRSRWSPYH